MGRKRHRTQCRPTSALPPGHSEIHQSPPVPIPVICFRCLRCPLPVRRCHLAPAPQKTSRFIPTLSPHAILLSPSVPHGWPEPTELWLAEGGEFRFAGAVPAGRELAKLVPGQRGGLSHRGGWHKGVSREWPEPVASPSRARRRRRPIRMACGAGRAPGRCGVTPGAGLTRPCRVRRMAPSGAGGRGRVRSPKGRTRRNRPGLASSIAGRRAGLRPEGAGVPHRWGAGETRQAASLCHHGPFARAPQSGVRRTRRCSMPPAGFLSSRAGFWRGLRVAGDLAPTCRRHPRPPSRGPFRDPSRTIAGRGIAVWVLGSSPRMTKGTRACQQALVPVTGRRGRFRPRRLRPPSAAGPRRWSGRTRRSHHTGREGWSGNNGSSVRSRAGR
jgi:hypothetical protein